MVQIGGSTIETIDLKVKNKVFGYSVTFTDRVSIGGTGVGESEEDFRNALEKQFNDATDLVIDEVKYLGTVEDFIKQKQDEALAEAEGPSPTIN